MNKDLDIDLSKCIHCGICDNLNRKEAITQCPVEAVK